MQKFNNSWDMINQRGVMDQITEIDARNAVDQVQKSIQKSWVLRLQSKTNPKQRRLVRVAPPDKCSVPASPGLCL
ncbi:MAG: hypothetical protein Ct9H300mP13_0990 [Gammaproteobacteria bacterium]|nr:MAG: hypothetical protein Ct9H300mP13_0990 [Gammaproteobacteria bacterium]